MKNKAPIDSLCHILRTTLSGRSDGIGAFIGRQTVLTANHVVRDAESLTVTNTGGEKTARILDVISAKDIDAAIVILRDPIGRKLCPIAPSKAFNFWSGPYSGQLITFFDGRKTQHPVELCSKFDSAASSATFHANTLIKPGYSGSPILDQRGRLMALTTSIIARGSSSDEGNKSFFATQPHGLLSFLQSVEIK